MGRYRTRLLGLAVSIATGCANMPPGVEAYALSKRLAEVTDGVPYVLLRTTRTTRIRRGFLRHPRGPGAQRFFHAPWSDGRLCDELAAVVERAHPTARVRRENLGPTCNLRTRVATGLLGKADLRGSYELLVSASVPSIFQGSPSCDPRVRPLACQVPEGHALVQFFVRP